MRTTKKCCLFKEYVRVVCFVCIQVQNVPPSCSHPFCLYADKMQYKGFQPACFFQWLDLFADMADEIEIEVLQHGGNHHESHVFSHEGKGQMFQLFTLVFPLRFSPPTMMPPRWKPSPGNSHGPACRNTLHRTCGQEQTGGKSPGQHGCPPLQGSPVKYVDRKQNKGLYTCLV